MRNKMIELIREAKGTFRIEEMYADIDSIIDMPSEDEYIADHLIANGATLIPETGIEDMSDGYHTFKDLYYQRMMLTAALVKAYKPLAWKSHRHEDGEPCFGGGWFIVGITTPQGDYTYHYEESYWSLFDCEELPKGKPLDGHTEKDVTRLLSLGKQEAV